MSEREPVLYTFRRCPFAIRARMALVIAQVSCKVREIQLRNKPQEMLAISPKGTVPVLQLPDRVLEESLDIMLWALGSHDPQHWLATGSEQQAMLDLINRNDFDFKQYLDNYKYPDRTPEHSQQYYREKGEQFLKILEQRLSQQTFLFDNSPKLADVAIFPFIRQFVNVDHDWFEQSADYPKLRAWLAYFLNSELFTLVMHKYPVWLPDKPLLYLNKS